MRQQFIKENEELREKLQQLTEKHEEQELQHEHYGCEDGLCKVCRNYDFAVVASQLTCDADEVRLSSPELFDIFDGIVSADMSTQAEGSAASDYDAGGVTGFVATSDALTQSEISVPPLVTVVVAVPSASSPCGGRAAPEDGSEIAVQFAAIDKSLDESPDVPPLAVAGMGAPAGDARPAEGGGQPPPAGVAQTVHDFLVERTAPGRCFPEHMEAALDFEEAINKVCDLQVHEG